MNNNQEIHDAFKQFLKNAKYSNIDDIVVPDLEWCNDVERYMRTNIDIGELHPSYVNWEDYVEDYVYVYDPADVATPTHKRYKFFAYWCVDDIYYIAKIEYKGRI